MKYRVELEKNQLILVSRCLEMVSRIMSGQIDSHTIFPFKEKLQKEGRYSDVDKLELKLRDIKEILFPDLNINAHYGINSSEEDSTHLYEMYKQILHTFENVKSSEAEENGEVYHSNVHTSKPLRCTEYPLIKVVPLTQDLIREGLINEIID